MERDRGSENRRAETAGETQKRRERERQRGRDRTEEAKRNAEEKEERQRGKQRGRDRGLNIFLYNLFTKGTDKIHCRYEAPREEPREAHGFWL
jgi:hypothetical protein